MAKPISIAIKDTNRKLVAAVNESGLPACVLLPIITDLHRAVSEAANKEYETDCEAYKEANNGEDREEAAD